MALIQLNGLQGQSLPTVGDITNVATLGDLSDVSISGASTGQVLKYSGTEWINSSDSGLTALVEDTTPELGGNLDVNGFNISGLGNISMSGTQASQFLRRTTNDNNGVLQFGKDTSGLSESLLLKALVAFRAHNTANQYTIAHMYGERLSDANPSRQLVLGLYTDAGVRSDVLSISRDASSLDSINCLTSMNTLGIAATGNVGITGNLSQTSGTVDLTSTGDLNLTSALNLDLNSSEQINLTSVTELNIDAFKIISNAGYETTVDSTGVTNREPMLMNILLPNSKDLANAMSAFMDYGSADFPTQTQMTFKFGVKNDADGEKISGRLVSTYNDTTQDTQMQLRAYDPDPESNDHFDLAVTRTKAYSTVPFQYPAYTTTQRDALTPAAGWVLFNSSTTKLQVYTGSAWEDLH